MFKQAKEISDDKVNIAVQTYEMVDKHIRRLDGDLAKFEAELREKGRLSQTDDSDEDEEEEEDNKNKKKRGKKPDKNDPKGKKQKVITLAKTITLAIKISISPCDWDYQERNAIFSRVQFKVQ